MNSIHRIIGNFHVHGAENDECDDELNECDDDDGGP